MSIGRRNDLVSIERDTVTHDDYNEEIHGWAPLSQEWTAIYWGKGDERRQAAATQAQQVASFQMLSNPTTQAVTTKDRLNHDTGIWDIISIAPNTPDRGHIEFSAVRAL